MTPAFMPWIDKLHEVGNPILQERKRLEELSYDAQALERKALALRSQVEAGKSALLERVTKEWSLLDIEVAANAADADSLRAQLIANVDDPRLRDALRGLDGLHTGAEALRCFQRAGVLRSDIEQASADELRSAAVRLQQWFRFALLPVLDRVGE